MKAHPMKIFALTSLALSVATLTLTAQQPDPAEPGAQPAFRPAGPPREPRPLPLAVLEKFDLNADGKLDEQERAELFQQVEAAAGQRAQARPERFRGGPPGPGRHFGPPKEILDQYDVDKDGRLSESEHAAVKADIDAGKLQPPPRPPGPGAPPPPPSPSQILEKHDLDHDGKLDENELTAFLESHRPPPPPRGPRPGTP